MWLPLLLLASDSDRLTVSGAQHTDTTWQEHVVETWANLWATKVTNWGAEAARATKSHERAAWFRVYSIQPLKFGWCGWRGFKTANGHRKTACSFDLLLCLLGEVACLGVWPWPTESDASPRSAPHAALSQMPLSCLHDHGLLGQLALSQHLHVPCLSKSSQRHAGTWWYIAPQRLHDVDNGSFVRLVLPRPICCKGGSCGLLVTFLSL